MSGYCPAGKCECENIVTPLGFKYCSIPEIDAAIDVYEVCPWPSRRVRVKGEPWRGHFSPETEKGIDRVLKMGEAMRNGTYEMDSFNRAYAAGRLSGLREAREAVEKLLPDFLVGVDCSGGFNKPVHLVEVGAHKRGAILAAIDRLMEGDKKEVEK